MFFTPGVLLRSLWLLALGPATISAELVNLTIDDFYHDALNDGLTYFPIQSWMGG